MTRVLTTEAAKSAIKQMQNIITNGLAGEITKLDSQGKILSDSNVWDGPLAVQFRGEWQETKAALDKAQKELTELNQALDKISANIFAAGGQA